MNTNNSSSDLAREETETGLRQLSDEVLSGLSEAPKALPLELHLDERGSMLFDCLCTLPEFYPARAGTEILERRGKEIAGALGFDSMPIHHDVPWLSRGPTAAPDGTRKGGVRPQTVNV